MERNGSLLKALEDRVREDGVSIVGDPRTMRPTLAAFEDGKRQLERARKAVEAAPGDPFLTEEALLEAKATLDRDSMGGFNPGGDTQIPQSFQASTAGRMNGSPVFWDGPPHVCTCSSDRPFRCLS